MQRYLIIILNYILKTLYHDLNNEVSYKWRTTSKKKHIKLWKTPDVLIVHLKRFTTDLKQIRNRFVATISKNNQHIQYPMLLNMTKYNTHPRIFQTGNNQPSVLDLYDLVSVVEHSGSLRGGHYTAKARESPWIDEWFSYNDAHASRVSNLNEIVSTRGYMMFYLKRK